MAKQNKGKSIVKVENKRLRHPNDKRGGCIPFDVNELRTRIINAPKGLNNEQLAQVIGLSSSKFYDLKANNTEFLDTLDFYFNISTLEVLKSFTKIAIGYTYDEVVKELKTDPTTKKTELVITKVTTKHIAPNAQAAYNYLKNRMPDHFKDKIETVHNLGGNLENITFIMKGKG